MDPSLISTVAMLGFGAVILVGVIVRWIRAPRGVRSRLRHALGPIAGAGESYQELHTGQRGLQASIIEAVQEQEQGGGAGRDADAPR
ncbi:hypothetical protein ACFOE1_09930 [Agromyces mediolanus]|uniref:Uncharacterized protein n=1 Tax=Agromyces mediolanus TaxID=41986 RepID=A0A918FBX4_AGRME|nr:hypothetical protein [Agromyces mediolanus]GGR20213.1 hypothetical protein GCM10010196_11860 [Agromyces mediolanus]GLJ73189.1 hypothetical protein GCM10017583_24470 [Agromyces mediolanus]